MKRSTWIIGLVFSLFLVNNAFAAQQTHVAKITEIFTLENGIVVFNTDTNSSHCKTDATGNARNIFYLQINQNGLKESGFKNIFSVALTAFSTDKEVKLYFDDSTQSCYVRRIRIFSVENT